MARSSDSIFPLSILRDKTFQAGEIRRVLALASIYLVVTTVLMAIIYHQMIGSLIEGVAPLFFVSEDMRLVNEAVPSLSAVLGKWVASMMLVNLVLTIGLGIFITQKLGQPILAIKRSLREIGDGNLDVRLRETDDREFGEITTELSYAMASIRDQIAAAKHEIEQAQESIAPTSTEEASQEDVNTAVRNCKMALDFFQIDHNEKAPKPAA